MIEVDLTNEENKKWLHPTGEPVMKSKSKKDNDVEDVVENAGKGNPYRAKDGKFTTGGTKNGMTPEDAAKGTNPGYATGETAYKENCQKCVPTYELRRRGIDVQALPFDSDSNAVSHNLGQQRLWQTDKMDYNWHEVKMVNGNPKTITKPKMEAVKALRSFPKGARVQMNYSHGRRRIGHTIMVEMVSKSKKYPHGMMFVDPQNNTISGGINLKDKSRISLIRLDNKTMNPDMAGTVAKPN